MDHSLQRPYNIDENPAVIPVINKWMKRVSLGFFGGGAVGYLLVRGRTRWSTPIARYIIRANAAVSAWQR